MAWFARCVLKASRYPDGFPHENRAMSFTGYVSTTDQATGKPVRPHLLTVSAERPAFENLVLAEVDPGAAIRSEYQNGPSEQRLARL